MNSDRYIKKMERFYDQYVEFYNSEKSKLKAFSELSNIQAGLKEIRSLNKSRIKENSETMIELFLVAWVYETNDKELTFRECIELADDINSDDLEKNIRELLNDTYGIKSIDQTRKEIVSKLKELFNYSDEGQIPFLIDSALEQLEELQILTPNFHAVLHLMKKIISLEYPEILNSFSQLSEKDQSEISRVGRPLNPAVPQTDIEKFVRISLFPNGKKTDNKKFIHQTGEREGTPNWNQLALKYFEENPALEINDVITKRWLIERIKNAYEVINTSMN